MLFSITVPFSSTRPRCNPHFFRPLQAIITDGVTLTIIMKYHCVMTLPHLMFPPPPLILSPLLFLDSQLPLRVLGGHLTKAPLMFYAWSHRQCPMPTKPLEGSPRPVPAAPGFVGENVVFGVGSQGSNRKWRPNRKNKFVFLSEPPCVTLALTRSHAMLVLKTSLSLCLQHLSIDLSQIHLVSREHRYHLLGWDLGWASVGIAKDCPTWVKVKSPSVSRIVLLFSTGQSLFTRTSQDGMVGHPCLKILKTIRTASLNWSTSVEDSY